jgi:hypothetical protein
MHAQAPHGTTYGEFRILAGIPVVDFGLSLVVFHEQPHETRQPRIFTQASFDAAHI